MVLLNVTVTALNNFPYLLSQTQVQESNFAVSVTVISVALSYYTPSI